MPQFKSPKYPHLTLQDDKGVWVQFKDGEADVTDAAALKRLRALPEDYEVTEVKTAGKKTPDPDAPPPDDPKK